MVYSFRAIANSFCILIFFENCTTVAFVEADSIYLVFFDTQTKTFCTERISLERAKNRLDQRKVELARMK